MYTPIKVRGKRKAKQEDVETAVGALKIQRLSASPSGSPSPGSPSSSAGLPPTRTPSRGSTPLVMRSSAVPPPTDPAAARPTARRQPLRLDSCLPVEILEHILLLSQNVNLARSSPRLGRMLSSRVLLQEMVIAAFGPTWDALFGMHSSDLTVPSHDHGDPDFQTAVLACPWVRMPLLLDAQHLWLRRQPLGRRQYLHLLLENMLPDSEDDDDSLLQALPSDSAALSRRYIRLLLSDALPASSSPILPPPLGDAGSHHACCTNLWSVHPLGCYTHNFVAFDDPADPDSDSNSDSSSKPSPPNLRTCFAVEQALVLQLVGFPSPPPLTASSSYRAYMLRRHWLIRRLTLYEFASTRQTHVDVHPRTRIPEWLLLAGGPYHGDGGSDSDSDSDSDERRCRRLQTVADCLLWLVKGGARLQAADSWEVTRQGYAHLMSIDVGREDDDETALDALSSSSKSSKSTYSADILVCTILTLFSSLGVFWPQWPASVRTAALDEAAARAGRDPAFARSQTCMFLRLLARYATPEFLSKHAKPPPRAAAEQLLWWYDERGAPPTAQ